METIPKTSLRRMYQPITKDLFRANVEHKRSHYLCKSLLHFSLFKKRVRGLRKAGQNQEPINESVERKSKTNRASVLEFTREKRVLVSRIRNFLSMDYSHINA
jgi:hypothetical protein